jgi:hypothetical protein
MKTNTEQILTAAIVNFEDTITKLKDDMQRDYESPAQLLSVFIET